MASASQTSVPLQLLASFVSVFMLGKKEMKGKKNEQVTNWHRTTEHSISVYKDNQILDIQTQKYSIEFQKIEINICFKPLCLEIIKKTHKKPQAG
jgi:hypothetical protein